MKKKRTIVSIFLVFLILCWNVWNASELADSEENRAAILGGELCGTQITSVGAAIAEEAWTPEVTGMGIYHVMIVHPLFVHRIAAKNTFGRLILLFFLLLCSSEAASILLFLRFSGFCNLRNCPNVVAFIHKQDGKKRLN